MEEDTEMIGLFGMYTVAVVEVWIVVSAFSDCCAARSGVCDEFWIPSSVFLRIVLSVC